MIGRWLSASLFGVPKGLWLIGAALLLFGVVMWISAAEKADDKANQEIGAQRVTNDNLHETLDRTEKANEVRETTVPGNRALYDECVRSARNAANCERFLPE